LHVLADQLHGLDRPAHATVTFAIGWLLALDGIGIGHLTLTLGALKVAVAACFLVYLADRLSAVVTRDAIDHGFLDAALLLAILVTITFAIPAIDEGDAGAIRLQALNLVLASVAAAISLVERLEAVRADEDSARACLRVFGNNAQLRAAAGLSAPHGYATTSSWLDPTYCRGPSQSIFAAPDRHPGP
jgi:hypothetical protein